MTTYDPTRCGGCGKRMMRPRPLGFCDDCRPVFVAELVAEYCAMGADPGATQAAMGALCTAIDLARTDRAQRSGDGTVAS